MNPSKYKINYDSICFFNPFWGLPDKKMVKRLSPIVKTMYALNKNARTPEVKMDMKTFPDHLHHVLYDFDNPF